MSSALLNGRTSLGASPDHNKSLPIFHAVSRHLPVQDEDQQFWWKLTGHHLARMMHEAGYPLHRQLEYLLFHRFKIVPCLGPRPQSAKPWYKSRVAAGAGDGSPIGYSWRFGTADRKPYIRNYIEPLGVLTGKPVDLLNQVATKMLLQDLSTTLPNLDLSLFWAFEPHLRPHFADRVEKEKFAGPSLLVGVEMSPDSSAVDIKTYLYSRVPGQISQLLTTILPQAMRDAYGDDVCLDSLNVVQDFMTLDPNGSQLTPPGTTAIDCCRLQDARVKFYVVTRNTSFDHISAIMTLGGRRPLSAEILAQLRELWYELKGLPLDFPTSEQLPPLSGQEGATNPNGVSFYFDIQPRLASPDVKAYFDVGKHATSDMAAAETVIRFLERHGRGQDPRAYLNVLQDIVPAEELETQKGTQAFFSVAVKKNELDITSYFIPQVYRRFAAVQVELNGQRRGLFE
ncbi:hypothetical protein CNMCM8927_003500 [Aspergillus lentulus]|uniref:4-O-dimethylallyl-L-tyrosine synthase n=1 Tax=Aspergillus lentulus TaxID=293939 RepID=A0AAN6BK08_ASPLE|nr:hypothetical protein CNMCM8927_003500 [Aspergillus lentulus]